MHRRVFTVIAVLGVCGALSARTWRVGPSRAQSSPSDLQTQAQSGDTIMIDGGSTYADASTWSQDNLTFIGNTATGGVHFEGALVNDKAVFIFNGKNTTMQHIEISSANSTAAAHNAAGVLLNGAGLTMFDCYVHDSDFGLVAADNLNADVTLTNCRFEFNGNDDSHSSTKGQIHNVSIGHVNSLTMQGCYVRICYAGHMVMSRAKNNSVSYCRIMDEDSVGGSSLVNFPNGGDVVLVGNMFQRGSRTTLSQAKTFVQWGNEIGVNGQIANPGKSIALVNNTFVNQMTNGGVYVLYPSGDMPDTLAMVNNLIVGPGLAFSPSAPATLDTTHNFRAADATAAGLRDLIGYDYHLTPASPAVNAGTSELAPFSSLPLPTLEYSNPNRTRPRVANGTIDIGAFEYTNGNAVHTPVASPTDPLVVYPNPAGEGSMVSIDHTGGGTVEIVSALGAVVARSTASYGDHAQLDTRTIAPGLYFVRVVRGAGIASTPLVVVR